MGAFGLCLPLGPASPSAVNTACRAPTPSVSTHSSKCVRVAVIPAISGVCASANAPPVPFPLAFPVRSLVSSSWRLLGPAR